MKPLVILSILLVLHISSAFSQRPKKPTIVPYNEEHKQIIYDVSGKSIYRLPKIVSVSKRWVSDHWNYNHVVQFEGDDRIVFRGLTELSAGLGNVRYRITISLKDNAFRVFIDNLTYYKYLSSPEVPLEHIVASYLKSVKELKDLINIDTSNMGRRAEKSHREDIEKKKEEAEMFQYTLSFTDSEFQKYITSLTTYLSTESDW